MGRTKPKKTTPKTAPAERVVDISTQQKRERWLQNSNAHPKRRQWVILTDSADIALIDSQLLRNSDGDQVYRLVHLLNKDGTIKSQWGSVRSFSEIFLHRQVCAPLPAPTCVQLAAWLDTIEEDALQEDPRTGIRDRVVKQAPISFAVPGWKKVSTKEMIENKVVNMMQMFKAHGFL